MVFGCIECEPIYGGRYLAGRVLWTASRSLAYCSPRDSKETEASLGCDSPPFSRVSSSPPGFTVSVSLLFTISLSCWGTGLATRLHGQGREEGSTMPMPIAVIITSTNFKYFP